MMARCSLLMLSGGVRTCFLLGYGFLLSFDTRIRVFYGLVKENIQVAHCLEDVDNVLPCDSDTLMSERKVSHQGPPA